MKRIAVALALLCVFGVVGCEDTTDVVVEHITHTIVEEDSTPDVVVVHETTTVYVTEEDTTPDVVQEFYSSAADMPAIIWDVQGGDVPMPKKFRQLNGGVAQTTVDPQDAFALSKAGGASSQFVEWRNFPLRDYIGGLQTANNGADPNNDIDIDAGVAMSDDNSYLMTLPAALIKQIDAAWAAGTNQGGLDTGAVAASTLYAIWLIANPTTDDVDVLFSLSFTAPTLPPGYTKQRLIAAIYVNGLTNINRYTQSGDEFRYTDAVLVIQAVGLTSGLAYTQAAQAPPYSIAKMYQQVLVAATYTGQYLQGGMLVVGSTGYFGGAQTMEIWTTGGAEYPIRISSSDEVMLDASRQFDYQILFDAGATPGNGNTKIVIYGFTMNTRSSPK